MLRNYNPPGEDGIQGKSLKYITDEHFLMVENVHKLIEEIWEIRDTPEDYIY